ncbi:hypothetical protein PHLGIDRAFT_104622 [Phlebiopsis gigantea 11061_1 CR5-6]|uniref:Uncharacterized protein n=1 Tax=Phlebiopsis gigantea (strain 11061_1 CR5-6) TaxID=745531 RepID=A0A0C3NSL5_PHLG1|nr:hypothetical protein PHLGIDRAFT_104622 [Phlebiopsis gigantea 11061_1 CR5-6]
MHTLTRTALKRVAVAPVSRTAAVSQRYSSTVHDNDPEVLEIEKQRNMDKVQHKTSTTIRNAPGWNEYLASSSEAAVKADRSDHSIHELQSETLEHMEQRHGKEPHTDKVSPKGAASGEERVGAYEATYERDETSGPLKSSPH